MQEDSFAWLFDDLKHHSQQLPDSWVQTVECFCLIVDCFETIPYKEVALHDLLECLLRLLDKSCYRHAISEKVAVCVKNVFRLLGNPSKNILSVRILQSLKSYGDFRRDADFYFLAHEGSVFLPESDRPFEVEISQCISRFYMQQNNYRLGQYYLAYSGCAKTEFRKNQNTFLAKLFCDEKNSFTDNQLKYAIWKGWDWCDAYFNRYFLLGNYFWELGDFPQAELIYTKLFNQLKYYGLVKTKTAVFNQYFTQCVGDFGKIKKAVPYSGSKPLQRNCVEVIERTAETERDWSAFLRERIIRPLCEETEKELGRAPCEFSVVALGSVARDEACLYSDFEFAIVWRKKANSIATDAEIKKYLQYFVALFELKIIALGETNELCFLTSSCEESKLSRALVKKRMKRGFQFDEGGNTPFSEKHGELLVFTVPFEHFEKLDALIKYNIIEALFVYGNDGGREVAEEFERYLAEFLDRDNFRQQFALGLLDDEFFNNALVPAGQTHIHIKNHLLLLPQWGVKAMAIFYGVQERNTLMRIEVLMRRQLLTAEMGALLARVVKFAFKLRMKKHRAHKTEEDAFLLKGRKTVVQIVSETYPALRDFFRAWVVEQVERKYPMLRYAKFFPADLTVVTILGTPAREKYEQKFTILLLGGPGVGKSELLRRYADETYTDTMVATIGVDLNFKAIKIKEKNYLLKVWDTAGVERFREMLRFHYYKEAQGFILVFDLTDGYSFFNILEYFESIVEFGPPNSSVILVGMKSDVKERKVNRVDVEVICEGLNCVYVEASAEKDVNVKEVFEMLSKMIYLKHVEKNKAFMGSLIGKDLSAERIETVKIKLEKIRRGSSELISACSPVASPASKDLVPATQAKNPSPYDKFFPADLTVKKISDDRVSVEKDHTFKIILLGASNAGKSRLFFRYTDNSYVEDNTVTIAPNLGLVKIKIGESFFKLQIWDVCGLERVQSITNSSYYGTHAYVLVFDLTDRESFFRLLELFQTILSYGSEGSSIIVVGAKSELVDLRAVLREEAEALAAGLGGPYIEISAKEDINVTEIFETLSKMVYLKQIEKNPAFLSSPLGRDLSDERIEVTRRKLEKIQDNKSAALIPHFSPIIRPAPKSPVAAVAARAPTPLSKTPTKSGARK